LDVQEDCEKGETESILIYSSDVEDDCYKDSEGAILLSVWGVDRFITFTAPILNLQARVE